ncbi:uncharacterized protein LOC133997808 isoform X2 [Scomber scombrus]|uniref:uncharacterized protein LOC133997808 isoform X2 n=1 Tax=Scomber scombrus TaxID=13677 RepID=UPI002DD8F04B|nr:uncharacterized protein LOC133997808 isoform X2 [Scomber scombrus]
MLAYKGGTFMITVLPDEGKMKEVGGLHHQLARLILHEVRGSVPANNVSSLQRPHWKKWITGTTVTFENSADFSGISHEVDIKVSRHLTMLC